ncbi:FAD-binding oxidoreductase [Phaeobacter sp.]|uniref:NAD(P)/FAD-dependent oxidoreductase n=1 Tax=Phaeobacter sp. TaxID=1902409 RepID=UPI0025E767E4|nr:FAD-binding oxidoreductase [Phaeobacter sp.]
MGQTCVIVGAGVVGVSAALALQTELAGQGGKVILIDKSGVAAETSQGNAGAFAFTSVEPMAHPGIVKQVPGWLLDPLGPLSIPPSYAAKLTPWLLRFWRASWQDQYRASIAAQAAFMVHCKAATERQIKDVAGEAMILRQGALHLYDTAAAFRAAKPSWDLRDEFGVDYTVLKSPEEIAEIQPGLSAEFTHAGFTPGWMSTTDPKAWVDHLFAAFLQRGGIFRQEELLAVQPEDDGVLLTLTTAPVRADHVVIAAGAWSHLMAKPLGDHLPLETERGYNTTLPPGAFDLRTSLNFGKHGFVVSPIKGGVRVGGAVELGGLDLPPNYKRADHLLTKAARFMPGLDVCNGTQWMGYRPSFPDSLPVIGRAKGDRRILYACGHGHFGLTQSAGTAELVADLVIGRDPSMDLTSFRADRF